MLSAFFSLIPAAPGYVGTFDAAVVFGLHALDVGGGQAIAFALLVRFVLFVPITIAGLILLLLTRYGGLRRRAGVRPERADRRARRAPRRPRRRWPSRLFDGRLRSCCCAQGLSFHTDDWSFVLERAGHSPGVFLEPHNEHLSLVPVTIYKVLLELVGLDHFEVFRLVLVLVNLAGAGVLLRARRARVRAGLGAAARRSRSC